MHLLVEICNLLFQFVSLLIIQSAWLQSLLGTKLLNLDTWLGLKLQHSFFGCSQLYTFNVLAANIANTSVVRRHKLIEFAREVLLKHHEIRDSSPIDPQL